jgi:hypothetical protein
MLSGVGAVICVGAPLEEKTKATPGPQGSIG